MHDIGQLQVTRKPLQELGPTFLQRVFTRKQREVNGKKIPFQVGLGPRYYTLRPEGEKDQDHVRSDVTTLRSNLPELRLDSSPANEGRRLINGEALREQVAKVLEPMRANGVIGAALAGGCTTGGFFNPVVHSSPAG